MCAKWRNGYDPQLILDRIAPDLSISDNDELMTTNHSFVSRYMPTLFSAVEFHHGIPESQKELLLRDCVKECFEKSTLGCKAIKQRLTKRENEFLNKEPVDYILATSISFKEMPSFRKTTVDSNTIIFSKSLPKQFDRTELKTNALYQIIGPEPDGHVAVRVTTTGRTPEEGAEKALDALALLMGIWNEFLTYHKWRWSMIHEPIAKLHLGPFHTLHYPDGKSATNTIWYEPSYKQSTLIALDDKQAKQMRKNEKWVLKQISKSPTPLWFKKAFMRYAAAVAEPKLETAFLLFWGLLEYLTDTRNDSYDKTVRRATFIFRDHKFARQELEHLRDLRNRIVHSGESSTNPYNHVYQIKCRVDEMLYLLLHDGYVEKTRQEINEFLDLPTEQEALQHKIELYRQGLNYRKPKKKNA